MKGWGYCEREEGVKWWDIVRGGSEVVGIL